MPEGKSELKLLESENEEALVLTIRLLGLDLEFPEEGFPNQLLKEPGVVETIPSVVIGPRCCGSYAELPVRACHSSCWDG